ncbi:MAG: hypothetical protein CME65_09675 [Halobacteriovoraceae bacterium]|nr:hypothetical protein [Halobacteriovoraceae bacterium]|tara:strand:- start:18433 stop:20049 length:1617 start_codon:yes stop_codon:yes gene_type:complete
MSKFDLKIYPMGGVAEIGSNMTIFEFEEHLVAIDYGILFPYEDFFDINYLIVDTTALKKISKPITLFITHGHEDHIGAVVHFIKEFPQAKIYAPRLARELILSKLDRANLGHEIIEYNKEFKLDFGEYTLRPTHVTHSIPDTYGVIINKGQELAFLFISDFKFDLIPSFEEPFDVENIKTYFSAAKRKIAFLDSTNILSEGKTLSESELLGDFEEILLRNKRTFFTLFASNIYRVKNLLEIAKKANRKVCFIGRSLNFYLDAADKVGLLSKANYPIVELDAIDNYDDPRLLYLVTGSQGEHLGATRRIANGDQKNIKLKEDDIFVFSSKAIPGNEKKIYRLINTISETGTTVITSKDQRVHASGHPAREDLKQLVSEINPTDIVPIHGETYFLRKHIDFIKDNFPKIQTHYMTNFDTMLIKGSEINIVDGKQMEPLIIHGDSIVIPREKISERRKMACNGLITIAINHKSKNIHVDSKGLPEELTRYHNEIKELAHYTAFQEFKNRDYDYVVEKIRIKIRTFAKEQLGYKPITLVSMV